MKTLRLEHAEEMLLALLQGALHQREVAAACLQQATAEEWLQCYRLAVKQGVSALAWEGIEHLSMTYSLPLDVKLSWALKEKEQLKKYRDHGLALNELTQRYAQQGIATMVLKGVGLSRLYPVPAHREGGDIDIYTYSADRRRMTDEEAHRLADELVREWGAVIDDAPSMKHSKFGFRGVTFENHRMFLHEAECQTTDKAERWLQGHIAPREVELLEGECRVEVPSTAFDTVFVALHAAQHYGMGLSLKHLCDWALLLMQGGGQRPAELEDRYLKLTMATLTQWCNRYLGLEVPIEEDEQVDEMVVDMMREILHPPYRKMPSGDSIRAQWWRLRKRWHVFRLKRRLLGVSFLGKIRGLCVRGLGLRFDL